MSRYVANVIRQLKKPNPDTVKQNARDCHFGSNNTNAHAGKDGYQAYFLVARRTIFCIIGLVIGIPIGMWQQPQKAAKVNAGEEQQPENAAKVNASEEGIEELHKYQGHNLIDKDEFEEVRVRMKKLNLRIQRFQEAFIRHEPIKPSPSSLTSPQPKPTKH